MKKLLFVLSLCAFSFTYAQYSGIVSGKILDAAAYNEPLLMASVSLKGTDWSTQTNFNGNFELPNIPVGDYVLQVDFLGYDRLEVPLKVINGERTAILESLDAKAIPLFNSTAINPTEAVFNATASVPLK